MTKAPLTSYEYEAQVLRIVDGDTVELYLTKTFETIADFGFRIYHRMQETVSTRQNFRLAGINAPELKGASHAAGVKASEALKKLLDVGAVRAETFKPDKYGRWLVRLYVKQPDNTELCANDEMIKNGNAVPYMENE
jgi:endonuclease YncB( thermonuclease family)